jgi:chorismate mutase
MSETSLTASDPTDDLRRDLEGVDAALLSLVAQRIELGDRITAAKEEAGWPLHVGREIAMLRRLMAMATPALERELIFEVWRALIAASARPQGQVDVAVAGGRGDPSRMFDIARRHFGCRARIQHVGDPQAALIRALEQPKTCVAVTPWPAAPGVGAWWPALCEHRFHGLHMIAGLPLLGGQETPEACVFGAATPEAAGGDVSLLIGFDPHHRLARALKESGLDGSESARAEPRVLLRIEGFVGVDDPRAAALTQYGLESVRVLGSYARI